MDPFSLAIRAPCPMFTLQYRPQIFDSWAQYVQAVHTETRHVQDERVFCSEDLRDTSQLVPLLYSVHWTDMRKVPPEIGEKAIEQTAKALRRKDSKHLIGRNVYQSTQQLLWDKLADLANIRLGLGPTRSVSPRKCVPLFSEYDGYADVKRRRQLSYPELRTRDEPLPE